jgi:hypothetical protein
MMDSWRKHTHNNNFTKAGMKIVTRQEAIARGLNRYFNGNPCVHGHIGERYTLTANCVQCILECNLRSRERVRCVKVKVNAA